MLPERSKCRCLDTDTATRFINVTTIEGSQIKYNFFFKLVVVVRHDNQQTRSGDSFLQIRGGNFDTEGRLDFFMRNISRLNLEASAM